MKISDELRAAGSRLFLRESDGYGTKEHGSELMGLAAMTLAMRTERRKAWKQALADAEAALSGKEDGNEHD